MTRTLKHPYTLFVWYAFLWMIKTSRWEDIDANHLVSVEFFLSLYALYLLAMVQVADLRSSMQKNWPTLACPSGNGVSFWTHEWEKHGTCSESVLDQHGYFQAALSLQKQANLLQALASAGKSSSFSHSPAPFRVVPWLFLFFFWSLVLW